MMSVLDPLWKGDDRVAGTRWIVAVWLLLAAPMFAEPPNILLIISDDQAWTDYGFMGHSQILTPHLDRLAEQSLTFTRGYVPSSLCRPSLASIVTGLYPHQHRIVGNDPAPLPGLSAAASQTQPAYLARRQHLIDHLDRVDTLPKLLGARRYASFQSGKWWEGSFRRGGFTAGMTRGFPEPGGRHGDEGLKIGREGLQPIFDFIEQAQANEQPFLVWYAPLLPHTPHNPPGRLLDRYRDPTTSEAIAKYWAMCSWFDETCGELLDYLDQHQLRDNTIVVYITDNGWINRADRSAYAPRSKRSPYEGGIRTPIMIRYPGHMTPQIDDLTLASSLDIVPTLLRACGLMPTSAMPGIDLLDAQARASRKTLHGEIFEHDVVDVERPEASLRYRWTIRMPWKLIVPNPERVADESVQLYHLITDPEEQSDVAQRYPEIVDELRWESGG